MKIVQAEEVERRRGLEHHRGGIGGGKTVAQPVVAKIGDRRHVDRDFRQHHETDHEREKAARETEAHGARDRGWRGAGGRFDVRDAELFLGNAGTAFRPLTAVLALNGGDYRLSGVARMHERPIGDLVDALRQLGADIRYLGDEGFPPLQISPARISGDVARVRGDVSSQFLTGLLMALPLVAHDRDVVVAVEGELISKPYVELTLNMMARFGIEAHRHGWHRCARFNGTIA